MNGSTEQTAIGNLAVLAAHRDVAAGLGNELQLLAWATGRPCKVLLACQKYRRAVPLAGINRLFSEHVQPLHQSVHAVAGHTQAALHLLSRAWLGERQVALLGQRTLHLLAGCRVEQREAAGVLPIRLECLVR